MQLLVPPHALTNQHAPFLSGHLSQVAGVDRVFYAVECFGLEQPVELELCGRMIVKGREALVQW